MFATRMLSSASVLLLAGCINDPGGGTMHTPPSHIPANSAWDARLECVAITGHAASRYSDVRLHYRVGNAGAYTVIPATREAADDKTVFYVAEMPKMPGGVEVEYYFTFIFDREQRSRYFPPVPVR